MDGVGRGGHQNQPVSFVSRHYHLIFCVGQLSPCGDYQTCGVSGGDHGVSPILACWSAVQQETGSTAVGMGKYGLNDV